MKLISPEALFIYNCPLTRFLPSRQLLQRAIPLQAVQALSKYTSRKKGYPIWDSPFFLRICRLTTSHLDLVSQLPQSICDLFTLFALDFDYSILDRAATTAGLLEFFYQHG
jgi:hypothetical protein